MPDDKNRVSRRDVLRGAGAAALVGAIHGATARRAQAAPGIERLEATAVELAFDINGKTHRARVEPRTTLLDTLRDRLGLTGTKRACDRGACGACTVELNGKTVNACMMLAVDAHGRKIRTVEGLSDGAKLHPIQDAFIKHDALQCGFCTPGMLMSCALLVENVKNPTDAQIREAVAGNLCRCGTYPHVFSACREAAQ
jgi:carbon-monoxide dehydrogenase small subunit/xanthine dehydrogenase YagT iron-sulfur-binding subunit